MTEQAGVAETPASTPPAAAVETPAAESFIGSDGTLKEGWQEHFVPEDFKGRPCYKAVGNDLKSIMRHLGNQDIAISKQGKGIFVPGPDASPSEIAEFRKSMGVPEKSEGYQFVAPKELATYYPPEIVSQVRQAMHQIGVTPAQFSKIMELDAARLVQSQKDMQENPEAFYEEIKPFLDEKFKVKAEAELKTKWGDAYESRLLLANLAIAENTQDGPDREALLGRIGNDPMVADFIASMQLKYHTEAKGVDTTVGSGIDKRNIDQKINELSALLTDDLRRTNRGKYETFLAERTALYAVKYPEKN